MRNIYNQNVLIIGSDMENIRALSILLAKQHAKIYIITNNKSKLEQLETELGNLKTINYGYLCNFDQSGSLIEKLKFLLKEKYSPDILINTKIGDVTPDLFLDNSESVDKYMELNLQNYIETIKLVYPKMLEKRKGCIVNIYNSMEKDNILNNIIYRSLRQISDDLNGFFKQKKLKELISISAIVSGAESPAKFAETIFHAVEKNKKVITLK